MLIIIIGCSDGEVQLSGGSSAMEGTVEICYRNLWGLVLTTDWNDDDTAVACATAGFARYGIIKTRCIVNNSFNIIL